MFLASKALQNKEIELFRVESGGHQTCPKFVRVPSFAFEIMSASAQLWFRGFGMKKAKMAVRFEADLIALSIFVCLFVYSFSLASYTRNRRNYDFCIFPKNIIILLRNLLRNNRLLSSSRARFQAVTLNDLYYINYIPYYHK